MPPGTGHIFHVAKSRSQRRIEVLSISPAVIVVAGGEAAGVLQFVQSTLDQASQSVEGAIHGETQFAFLAHRKHRHDGARLHDF
jgi:hypothetical protein